MSDIGYDTDGDGVADSYDTDDNGYFDLVTADTNGDGIVDLVGTDQNENGYFEGVMTDTDGDGDFDLLMADNNENGVHEAFSVEGGDGMMHQIFDFNENGVADAAETSQGGYYPGASTIGGSSFSDGIHVEYPPGYVPPSSITITGPTELDPTFPAGGGPDLLKPWLGAGDADADGMQDDVDPFPHDAVGSDVDYDGVEDAYDAKKYDPTDS
ncbi:MAG: hypothetical protein IT198_01710 [Acidimicrobiia bacterium]|nr:hypothetical protein [Acidimicrobiia bacterium]